MTELRDATVVVEAIRDGYAYVDWAPGDSTVYRVALVSVHRGGLEALDDASDFTALLVMLGRTDARRSLLLEKPREGRAWNPEMFADAVDDDYLGWWPGVRPLLAALGWTDPEYDDLAYRVDDVTDLEKLLKTRGGTES